METHRDAGAASPDPKHALAMELLLLSARMVPGAEAEHRLATLLQESVDWDAVLEAARRHRVLPLVYRTLSGAHAERVPADVLSRLRTEFRTNARRNLLVTAELLRVVDVLAEHDIAVIPYKGPALATVVYGDVSLRQFVDLDVILHESDVARANALLGERGYRTARDITGKDVGLFNETLGVTLEVHWSITAERWPVQIAPDRLWRNLQHCQIGGRSVLTHAPEDLLWILCIHGAQHRWEKLSWLCDVAEIIRGQKVDWDRAAGNAGAVGAGRILFLGILLAHHLLGAEIPRQVRPSVEADPILQPLAAQVQQWLFAPSSELQNLGDAERFYIRLRERLGDRARIAFKLATAYLAPTTRDREMLRLPRYLSWLLYVARPIRLTWSYGLAPVKRFLKGLIQS